MIVQYIKPVLYWPCGVCQRFVSGRRVRTGRIIVSRRQLDVFDDFALHHDPPSAPVIETVVVCRWCGTPEGTGQVTPLEEYEPRDCA